MKKLFEINAKWVRLIDEDRMIFWVDDKYFVDQTGNVIPEDESIRKIIAEIKASYEDEEDDDDDEFGEEHNYKSWLKRNDPTELGEDLFPYSVVELISEIDHVEGCYGFRDRSGEFIIEPQYLEAWWFTQGLAGVSIGKTWYKSEDGHRFVEYHSGYINNRGETVIPFMFDSVWPFNDYEVAVVEFKDGIGRLIDKEGKFIPGTEKMDFCHYDSEDRYMKFLYIFDRGKDAPYGLYDTKERKVLLEPCAEDINVRGNDLIELTFYDGEFGEARYTYVDYQGKPKYPWLVDKGFKETGIPNDSLVTVVCKSQYIPTKRKSGVYYRNGKNYEKKELYGLYNAREEFILPIEYNGISEIGDNIFRCKKGKKISVYQLEECDY